MTKTLYCVREPKTIKVCFSKAHLRRYLRYQGLTERDARNLLVWLRPCPALGSDPSTVRARLYTPEEPELFFRIDEVSVSPRTFELVRGFWKRESTDVGNIDRPATLLPCLTEKVES